jgi:hypothetical protein
MSFLQDRGRRHSQPRPLDERKFWKVYCDNDQRVIYTGTILNFGRVGQAPVSCNWILQNLLYIREFGYGDNFDLVFMGKSHTSTRYKMYRFFR